jgi:hypothetical protein
MGFGTRWIPSRGRKTGRPNGRGIVGCALTPAPAHRVLLGDPRAALSERNDAAISRMSSHLWCNPCPDGGRGRRRAGTSTGHGPPRPRPAPLLLRAPRRRALRGHGRAPGGRLACLALRPPDTAESTPAAPEPPGAPGSAAALPLKHKLRASHKTSRDAGVVDTGASGCIVGNIRRNPRRGPGHPPGVPFGRPLRVVGLGQPSTDQCDRRDGPSDGGESHAMDTHRLRAGATARSSPTAAAGTGSRSGRATS